MIGLLCLYSPVVGSSLATPSLFVFFFFQFFFFSCLCSRVSTFLFICAILCSLFRCLCMRCTPLSFALYVLDTGLNLSEHITMYVYILHWVLLAVCRTVCMCCHCYGMLLLNIMRCAALLLLAGSSCYTLCVYMLYDAYRVPA